MVLIPLEQMPKTNKGENLEYDKISIRNYNRNDSVYEVKESSKKRYLTMTKTYKK